VFEKAGERRRERFFRLARRRPAAMGGPTESDENAARREKRRASFPMRCLQRLISSSYFIQIPPPAGFSNTP